jgi:hypothetical protein
MKKRDIGNLFLHLGFGLAFALAVGWNYWTLIGVVLVFAFLREQAQHRYILDAYDKDPLGQILYGVNKRTFFDFGWLGWKQVSEIAQWTGGSAIGVALWEFLLSRWW